MSKLIILSGPPCSGKSTWANSSHPELVGKKIIISSDEIRKELTGSYNKFTEEPEVWRTLSIRVYEAQADYDVVILDATSLVRTRREFYIDVYSDIFDEFIIVYFDVDYDILVERNRNRVDKVIPDADFDFLYNRYEMPDETEAGKNVRLIKVTHSKDEVK